MMKGLGNFFQNCIAVLSVPLLALLTLWCVLGFAHIWMGTIEHVGFYRNGPVLWLLTAGLCAALLFLRKLLLRVGENTLFLLCTAVFLLAGVFLIAYSSDAVKADQWMIYKHVNLMNEGDYQGLLPGHYLSTSPYLLGYVSFVRLFSFISTSPRVMFAVNLVCVPAINFFLWKIAAMLFRDSLVNRYTILLSYLFLPQFFYILFAYGTIPGFCAVMAGWFCMLRWMRETAAETKGNLWQRYAWIPGAVCMGVAVVLKNNYIIMVIAMCIVLGLRLMTENAPAGKRLLRYVPPAVLTLALAAGLPKAVNLYYQSVSGMDFGSGAPVIVTVAMGLQDTNAPHLKDYNPEGRIGGWYNGYKDEVWAAAQYNADDARELALTDIEHSLLRFESDPGRMRTFFYDKLRSTWCDPMFESVWSGPLEFMGQPTYHFLLQNLYKGGRVYVVLEKFMNALNILLYGFAAAFVFLAKPLSKDPAYRYPYLCFLGAFLFHLVAETKSQYVYMYLFQMIPFAVYGMIALMRRGIQDAV